MSYLDLLKESGNSADPLLAEPGKTLDHQWLGKSVDSPRGKGRLIWTDGFRAAVSEEPNLRWLVDLADVRLARDLDG